MKKVKTFFYSFKNSAFKPSYYKDVIKAPFSFSLKYFLCLFFFLNLTTVFAFSFLLQQKVGPYLKKANTQIPGFYPAQLEINIKNGQVDTNVQEPYFIPLNPELFPQELKQGLKQQPIQNILVIDTQAEASEIKKYQTFAFLTKDSIAFLANRGEIRIQSLEEIKDFTLNRKIVKELWEKITPYFRWIVPLLIICLLLLLPPSAIILKFIYITFFSLAALIIVKLFKNRSLSKISYVNALQINLHAITLPTIIIAIFQFLGAIPRIPFFQTIILLIFNGIIFSSIKEK